MSAAFFVFTAVDETCEIWSVSPHALIRDAMISKAVIPAQKDFASCFVIALY